MYCEQVSRITKFEGERERGRFVFARTAEVFLFLSARVGLEFSWVRDFFFRIHCAGSVYSLYRCILSVFQFLDCDTIVDRIS